VTDHLGSVRDVLNSQSCAGTGHIDYTAFGQIARVTHQGATVSLDNIGSTRFLYTGREFEANVGLQYNRARYFDAAIARWISQDPIGYSAGDTNLFRYASNDPVTNTDPSGLAGVRDWQTWKDWWVRLGLPGKDQIRAVDAGMALIDVGAKVWSNTDDESIGRRIYIAGGMVGAEITGVRGVSDACSERDAVTGKKQGFCERFEDGLIGSVQLGLTAFGGAKVIAGPKAAPAAGEPVPLRPSGGGTAAPKAPAVEPAPGTPKAPKPGSPKPEPPNCFVAGTPVLIADDSFESALASATDDETEVSSSAASWLRWAVVSLVVTAGGWYAFRQLAGRKRRADAGAYDAVLGDEDVGGLLRPNIEELWATR
jgi:RHS repeat-associated protein